MHRSGQIKNKRLGMKSDKYGVRQRDGERHAEKGSGTPTLQQFWESNPKGRGAAYGAEQDKILKDFFHLPPVSPTPVVHLELQISKRINEKFETALKVYSGAWGSLFHKKT